MSDILSIQLRIIGDVFIQLFLTIFFIPVTFKKLFNVCEIRFERFIFYICGLWLATPLMLVIVNGCKVQRM